MQSDVSGLLSAMRPLCIEDQHQFDDFTAKFPPYSDFDFPSLWSWNVKGEIQWGMYLGCLFIRFSDYENNEPFFTFIGNENCDSLAKILLSASKSLGWVEELRLVPDVCAQSISDQSLEVHESRDNFDYVYEASSHVDYSGPRLKSHRGHVNYFKNENPNFKVIPIDLNSGRAKSELLDLWKVWERKKGCDIPNEALAFERFLSVHHRFNSCVTGIEVDGKLIAFDVTVIGSSGCGNSLFSKADVGIRGVNSVLSQGIAKSLVERGCNLLNFEQDLGILGLRAFKESFAPSEYLKKYNIRRNDNSHSG